MNSEVLYINYKDYNSRLFCSNDNNKNSFQIHLPKIMGILKNLNILLELRRHIKKIFYHSNIV